MPHNRMRGRVALQHHGGRREGRWTAGSAPVQKYFHQRAEQVTLLGSYFAVALLPLAMEAAEPNSNPMGAPTGVVTRSGDRSVVLHWQCDARADLTGYCVYRAQAEDGRFAKVTPQPDRKSVV